MKNLKTKILSIAKVTVLLMMVSLVTGQTLAQWAPPTSTPPPEDPLSSVPRITLPLHTGTSPQLKKGPLLINASNAAQYFGLTIPYWGILISPALPPIGTITAPQGLLHINNDGRKAIRIEGSGPAFVTDSSTARIGIGTLDPQYTIDIHEDNQSLESPIVRLGGDEVPDEVSLQVNGRVKIMGGNPFPGAYLATDQTGVTVWQVPPSLRISPNNSNSQLLQYVSWPETFSESGIASTASLSPDPLNFLKPGQWHVTVSGTIGNTPCDNCSYTVTTSIRFGANGSLGTVDTPILIRDHPDGNAGFSITRIVNIPPNTNSAYGRMTVSVADDISGAGTTEPLINGVSAYWIGF